MPPYLRTTRSTIVATATLTSLFVLVAWLQFGSLGTTQAWLSGERLAATPAEYLVTRHGPDGDTVVDVTLQNLSDRPISLLGMRDDCECVAASSLPLDIPARATIGIPVSFQAASLDPLVARDLVFYYRADANSLSQVVVRVRASDAVP